MSNNQIALLNISSYSTPGQAHLGVVIVGAWNLLTPPTAHSHLRMANDGNGYACIKVAGGGGREEENATGFDFICIHQDREGRKKSEEKKERKIQLVLSSSYCFALCLIFIWSFFSCGSVTQYTCILICLLDLFNVELSLERVLAGTKIPGGGESRPCI